MSRAFREKILKEFTDTGGKKRSAQIRAYRQQWVNDIGENGTLRIKERTWTKTFYAAVSNIPEKDRVGLPDISMGQPQVIPSNQWKKIYDHIKEELSKKVDKRFATFKIEYTSTVITVRYARGLQRKTAPGQGDVDLENYIDVRLRIAMESFFSTGEFAKISEKVIEAAKTKTQGTGMTIGHGDDQEPYFGSSIADSRNFSQKQIEERVKSGKETAPGAKGTLVSKRFIKSLISACTTEFKKNQWFEQAHEVIDAKWAELFGYSSDVKDRDTKNKVQSNVKLSAELMPTKITNAMKLNRGIFDKAIQAEIIKFLKDEDYFAQELIRLKPSYQNAAADITSGSDSVKDRIPKAAVKLAQTAILENLQEKYVRKKTKAQSKQKKGSSKTRSKMSGSPSSKIKRTKDRAPTRKSSTRKSAASNPQSAVALKELINAALPQELLQRMHPPALQNRTGRFRNSAEVTNVNIGPRGGTQIDYTYMKMPYQTFEPGYAQGSVNRDPRRLIGGTIREVAQRLTGNKFITTRRR